MTGPANTGGRPTVLPLGVAGASPEPKLLTETAQQGVPLLVVNISTDLAWLAADSSVGPSSGIPLEPGTAVPWIAGGTVYAVADQGAAAAITVYITSAAGDWTPSPAAIGAQVAAQLLAQGVPSVYRSKKLFSGTLGGPAVGSIVDTHDSASVNIALSSFDGVSFYAAAYQFFDSASNTVVETGTLTADSNAVGGSAQFVLPCVGDSLFLYQVNNTFAVHALVVGSNRAVPKKMLGSDFAPVRTFQGTIAASAPTGTVVNLLGVDAMGSNAAAPIKDCSNYNGACHFIWQDTNAAAGAPSGDLFFTYVDAAGVEQQSGASFLQGLSTTLTRVQAGHPFGYVKWRYKTAQANSTNAVQVTLLIIPAQ